MPHERDSPYSHVFDATQSPTYLDFLAARFGVKREPPAPGHRRVYLDLVCAQWHTILALAPFYLDIDFIGVDLNDQHVQQCLRDLAVLRWERFFVLFKQIFWKCHPLILRLCLRCLVERRIGSLMSQTGLSMALKGGAWHRMVVRHTPSGLPQPPWHSIICRGRISTHINKLALPFFRLDLSLSADDRLVNAIGCAE